MEKVEERAKSQEVNSKQFENMYKDRSLCNTLIRAMIRSYIRLRNSCLLAHSECEIANCQLMIKQFYISYGVNDRYWRLSFLSELLNRVNVK